MNRTPTCNACECGTTAWATATKWGIVIVDTEDRQWLERFGWHITNSDRLSAYAHSDKCARARGKSGYLHQAIMGAEGKIDHENGNGLDCRKSNLRPASQQENMFNRRGNRVATSEYKGVHLKRASKQQRTITDKWVAQMRGEHQKTLGSFGLELDAAICYNYHAAHLFGDFARINAIPQHQYAHE